MTINQELDESTGKSLSDSVLQEAFTRINVWSDLNYEAIFDFARICKEQNFIEEVPPDEQLYVSR